MRHLNLLSQEQLKVLTYAIHERTVNRVPYKTPRINYEEALQLFITTGDIDPLIDYLTAPRGLQLVGILINTKH